jgi:hypothetical protein
VKQSVSLIPYAPKWEKQEKGREKETVQLTVFKKMYLILFGFHEGWSFGPIRAKIVFAK